MAERNVRTWTFMISFAGREKEREKEVRAAGAGLRWVLSLLKTKWVS